MHKEFLMGNEAIALGAIAAGVNLIAGYPGTPSSEVLETAAKHRSEDINGLSMRRLPLRSPPEPLIPEQEVWLQ